MRLALPLVVLSAALPAQITATIDDSRSHGVLGDANLSLDEAIRLANGSLTIAQLSPQERARLSGVSGVIARILIDASVTPVITLEQVLTDIIGQHHAHVHVEIEGVPGPAGLPVIDGGNHPIVLPSRTNHAHVRHLVLRGGLVGVDYDTTLHYHPSVVGELVNVRVENARDVAVRVRNPRANGSQSPIMLQGVLLRGSGVGLEIVDDSQFGNTEVYCEDLVVEDCDVGIAVAIDSAGGDHILQLLRTAFHGVDACIAVDRVSATSTSRWRIRCVHGSYRAGDRALELDTTATGTTTVELHHLDVHGGIGPTGAALIAGTQGGQLALVATECTFTGPVHVAAGTSNSSLRLHNDRLETGELVLALSAGTGDVQWTSFTACGIELDPVCTSLAAPITFTECEMVRSDVNDRSAGRSRLQSCFLGGSVISSNVQNVQPQLTPWMGRATVAPSDPP
ncbi:MAG TPA: hypothetical protein VK081_00985, partial [Planctomycetota bacterium]|nr:hypothetical protein [Planctomycetota bacterium]